MIKKFIECGEIVGTHGVRGEVRINPWTDSPTFLSKFKKFYTNAEGTDSINVISIRPANNIVLAKFENTDSVEKATLLRGTVLYIKREDANLGGRHFIQELIGCTVLSAEDGGELGTLTDVINLPANDVWQITSGENNYLVPAIDEVIVSVDVENERIVINRMKGIFDDED